jgi:hypothetical protein
VRTVVSARDVAAPTSVLSLAFDEGYSNSDLQRFTAGVDKTSALAVIRDGVALLSRQGADEAASYKSMLLEVGNAVANATKEGGFLGIGGKRVSDAEAAILQEIAAVVNG